jgi:kynurenine 3-monooxygenase
VAKFYLIGLGPRGQSALDEFGAWKGVVEDRCVAVVGRRDWQPGETEGTERIFTTEEKRVPTQVLPRDKLVGCLHQYILQKYANRIELNYGYEVHPVDFDYRDGTAVLMQVIKCDSESSRLNPSTVKTATEEQKDTLCSIGTDAKLVSAGLLVAADGSVRTVANAMERIDQERYENIKNPISRLLAPKAFRVKRYVDDNQRIYKSIPMKIPKGWRPDLNYGARSEVATYDALPANTKGDYCGVLLLKKDHPLAQADTDPADLRKLIDESFPYFNELIDDETIAEVAKKPVSYLPSFRYAGPRLHQGNRCVILGDCAHTVKPYFGLGANSALEDVRILGQMLDEHSDLPTAIRAFSRRRAAESKALVRVSRDLDRPGKLGVITFLIPIILDSIFSKFLPQLFTPNVINMLQREGLTFTQVARRKRFDRIGQLAIVGAGLTATGMATSDAVQGIAAALGCSPAVVLAGGGAVAAAGLLFQSTKPTVGLPNAAGVLGIFAKKRKEDTKEEESL